MSDDPSAPHPDQIPAGDVPPASGLAGPNPRRREPGTLIAWMIIGLSVGFIVVMSAMVDRTAARAPSTPIENAEFDVAARQLLGMNWILERLNARGAGGPLWTAVDKAARSPEERVRKVPLAFEVDGKEAALARLAELKESAEGTEVSRDVRDLQALYTLGNAALGEEARQRLLSRHDWFARLAMAHAEGGNPQDRAAILSGARRTIFAAIIFLALAGVGSVAGLVFLIIAIIRYSEGRLHTAYTPEPAAPGLFLEAAAIYIGMFAAAMPVSLLLYRYGSAGIARAGTYALMAAGVVGGMAWPLLRGLTWRQLRTGLGLHTGRGVFREIGAGIVGYCAGLPLLIISIIILLVLLQVTGKTSPSHPIVHQLKGNPLQLVFIFILATLWAPITEELMFRGAMFHHLRRKHGWWLSALVVAFVFAVIHPQGWLAVHLLMTIAMVLAGIRQWRGSIIAPITAHALNNGAVMTLAVFMMG